MRSVRVVSLVFWIGFALACAPRPPPRTIAAGYEGAPGVETILVLPVNVATQLPEEFSAPAKRVNLAIANYVRESGRKVVTLSYYDARAQLRETLASLGKTEGKKSDPTILAPRFAASLHETMAFDALVMPSLVYREGRILQGTKNVEWDGVRRELEIVGAADRYMSIYYEAYPAGKMDAVSLHLFVFDPAGTKVFDGFGGLDLIHRFDMHDSWEKGYRPTLKKKRLTDEVAVREGIAIAFHPYLTFRPAPAANAAEP